MPKVRIEAQLPIGCRGLRHVRRYEVDRDTPVTRKLWRSIRNCSAGSSRPRMRVCSPKRSLRNPFASDHRQTGRGWKVEGRGSRGARIDQQAAEADLSLEIGCMTGSTLMPRTHCSDEWCTQVRLRFAAERAACIFSGIPHSLMNCRSILLSSLLIIKLA
jgi:hypothetical protein